MKSAIYTLSQLTKIVAEIDPTQIFVFTDEIVVKDCYPLIKDLLPSHQLIVMPEGEIHKTLETCVNVWRILTIANADRKSCLINLGGGVIGDMGGFIAGCYKRGIAYIQIPTTLLSMVDASTGAKTGIDFLGFKNQLGLFNEPEAIVLHTGFLQSLSRRHLLAGFAEVIKHYAIADKDAFYNLLKVDVLGIDVNWENLVRKNIAIKTSIAEKDPYEKKDRKALNFGHTIGHALESHYLNSSTTLLHGEAVAAGMLIESIISFQFGKISEEELQQIIVLLKRHYTLLPVQKHDQATIVNLIYQDKKNENGQVLMTLLEGIGNYSVNNSVNNKSIAEAFQHYNRIVT